MLRAVMSRATNRLNARAILAMIWYVNAFLAHRQ